MACDSHDRASTHTWHTHMAHDGIHVRAPTWGSDALGIAWRTSWGGSGGRPPRITHFMEMRKSTGAFVVRIRNRIGREDNSLNQETETIIQ